LCCKEGAVPGCSPVLVVLADSLADSDMMLVLMRRAAACYAVIMGAVCDDAVRYCGIGVCMRAMCCNVMECEECFEQS